MPNLDYFYGNESANFRFYRIPKTLLTGDWELSLEAATLYSLLLDRVGLSIKNSWSDGQGRVYIYFVQTEVQKRLHCGHNKATALMRELERSGLIERKRQGLGKPMKIYVKNFLDQENTAAENSQIDTTKPTSNEPAPQKATEAACGTPVFSAQKEAVQTAQNRQSRMPLPGSLECPKQAANDTEKKETDFIETNPSIPQPPCAYRKQPRQQESRMDQMRWIQKEIRENVDYDSLISDLPYDRSLFDGYISLMAEACCTSHETLRICGENLPAALVRKRFLSLEREHILYVRDCISNTTTHIGNIKAYTLAALYNAPATMEQYYAALVSRDMAFTKN